MVSCPTREYAAVIDIDRGAARSDRALMVRLGNSPLYRDYQRAFETMVGLPLALQAADSHPAPPPAAQAVNPFCLLLAAQHRSCAACLGLPMSLAPERATQTLECCSGTCESVVPIRLGRRIAGFLRTGPVRLRPPSPEKFRGWLRRLREPPAAHRVASLRVAYFASRVLAKPQHESVLRLLVIFAQHLSLLGNQLMMAATAAESPAITKARAFIAEHFAEELSHVAVARAVHMSPCYFSRVFRRETGLTFTAYLTRRRIESVKQSLLQPHTRITEAAFAAGFQSMSQFNRVFRHIVGESPSRHRERLSGRASPPLFQRALARTG